MRQVRRFIGRLSTVPIVTRMAFFEGCIQKFMPYPAELAERQGSQEMEYTDVHSVCDVADSQELYRALAAEMALACDSREPAENLFEGVYPVARLIQDIFSGRAAVA